MRNIPICCFNQTQVIDPKLRRSGKFLNCTITVRLHVPIVSSNLLIQDGRELAWGTWGGGSSSQVSTGVCRLWMLLQHAAGRALEKCLKLISLQSLFGSESNRADPAEDVGPKKKSVGDRGTFLSAL